MLMMCTTRAAELALSPQVPVEICTSAAVPPTQDSLARAVCHRPCARHARTCLDSVKSPQQISARGFDVESFDDATLDLFCPTDHVDFGFLDRYSGLASG